MVQAPVVLASTIPGNTPVAPPDGTGGPMECWLHAEQVAEELVDTLHARAAFHAQLVDQLRELGPDDGPRRLLILGQDIRAQRGKALQKWQRLIQRDLGAGVNARLGAGDRAHVGLDRDGVIARHPGGFDVPLDSLKAE